MEAAAGTDTKQYLVFKLGKEEYGIDIRVITTIIEKDMKIARVPKSPAFIKGVINLRGEIIPIMDIRSKFNLPAVQDTEETRIIIVNADEIAMGLIVDSVAEVIHLDEASTENITSFSNDLSLDYISGVGKLESRIVTLLNLENLINNSRRGQRE